MFKKVHNLVKKVRNTKDQMKEVEKALAAAVINNELADAIINILVATGGLLFTLLTATGLTLLKTLIVKGVLSASLFMTSLF